MRARKDLVKTAQSEEPGVLSLVLMMAACAAFLWTIGVANEAFAAPSGKTIEGAASGMVFQEVEAEFDGIEDPASALMAEVPQALPDHVFEVDHQIPIGDGRHIVVTETFTLRSLLRWPRRGLLFLSGSAFRGNHWSIPVAGYDGPAMAARRGFFAYTVDYLGVGESFRPADGTTVTLQANLAAMKKVVRYIRYRRYLPRIDVVGAGYGGSLAALLGEDRRRIRSVVMTAMLYDQLIGGPLTDPGFIAMLENAPDGYVFLPGEASLVFTTGAPQGVIDYIVATQGGIYPAENFLVAAGELPFFDPSRARVPGMILFGRKDNLVGPDGMDQLAEDYGRDGALLVVNEEAGHAPRTESPEIAEWYWRNLFAFVDGALPGSLNEPLNGARGGDADAMREGNP